MKRIVSLIMLTTIFALINMNVFAQDITVFLNEKQLTFDVQPQIINNRTMVPMRAIFEALGAKVEWNSPASTITGIKDNFVVVLKLNSTLAKVNNNDVSLDSPAISINGRTMVPLRFVAENMNMNVVWNQATQKIILDPILIGKYGRIDEIYDFEGASYMRIDTGTSAKRSTTEDGIDVYIIPLSEKPPLKMGQRITVFGNIGPSISYVSRYGLKLTFPSFKMDSYSTTPPIGPRRP